MNQEKALHLLIGKIFDQTKPSFMIDSTQNFLNACRLDKKTLRKVITASQMNRLRDIFISSRNFSSLIEGLEKFIIHQVQKDKEKKHWAYLVPREVEIDQECDEQEPSEIGYIFLAKIKNINRGFLDPLHPENDADLITALKEIVKCTQPEDLFDELLKEEPQREKIQFTLARNFFLTFLKLYRTDEEEAARETTEEENMGEKMSEEV